MNLEKHLLKFLINFVPSKRQKNLLRNKYFGQELPSEYPERIRTCENLKHIYIEQDGVDLIYKQLVKDKPSLICRFGTLELDQLDQFIENKNRNICFGNKEMISNCAGFFPATDYMLSRFASEMLEIIPNIDILGTLYYEAEFKILKNFGTDYKFTDINAIGTNNLLSDKPWSRALKNKKVLVISPFEDTIKSQYEKRKVLFKNEDVLPDFELKTLKAVQSIGVNKFEVPFKNWFEALEYMENQINNIDFDIALIGAGAYGMFLADYVKHIGKKAVHMGGVTQLLFGIKGRRWDDMGLYNEHWVRPSENEKPKGVEKVEHGTYPYW